MRARKSESLCRLGFHVAPTALSCHGAEWYRDPKPKDIVTVLLSRNRYERDGLPRYSQGSHDSRTQPLRLGYVHLFVEEVADCSGFPGRCTSDGEQVPFRIATKRDMGQSRNELWQYYKMSLASVILAYPSIASWTKGYRLHR